jgi:hypothetical protein
MPAKRISGKCNQQTTHKTLSIIGEYILAKRSKTDGTKNIIHGSGRSKLEQLDFCRNIINMSIRGVEIQLLRYHSTTRVIEIRATMDTRKKTQIPPATEIPAAAVDIPPGPSPISIYN